MMQALLLVLVLEKTLGFTVGPLRLVAHDKVSGEAVMTVVM